MKVKLPKNKAHAFDELASFGKDDILAGVMGYGCNSKFPEGKTWSELRALAKHDFDTFLQALVNGYEVEETPEDKVRTTFEYALEQIKKHDNGHGDDMKAEHFKGIKTGIITTLASLSIKIEGVNL